MNIQIAMYLGADLVSSVFSEASFDPRVMGFEGQMTALYPRFQRGIVGFIGMKLSFLLRASVLRGYDTVIFSNEAISARLWAPRARRVYYAHSISRHLFDQRDQYLAKISWYARPFAGVMLTALRAWYLWDLRSMHLILANSEQNAVTLRTLAPGITVEVLYPPVDAREFYPLEPSESRGNYYLSTARLAHAKRVDTVIRAFKPLPDHKLLLLHGANDPQKDEFRALADGAPNIEFKVLEDNSQVALYTRRAIAGIYISRNEDFGLNTIEALISGVPMITVAEGGFLESMQSPETGIMLPPECTPEELARAVREMTPEYVSTLRDGCIRQGQKFSLTECTKRLSEFI